MSNISKMIPKPWAAKATTMPWNTRDDSGKPFANAKRFNGQFYQTVRWKALRKYHITHYPICAECERKGRIVKGYFVDHITPISEGGQPMTMTNLQTLCKSCHASKTNKEIAHNKKRLQGSIYLR